MSSGDAPIKQEPITDAQKPSAGGASATNNSHGPAGSHPPPPHPAQGSAQPSAPSQTNKPPSSTPVRLMLNNHVE